MKGVVVNVDTKYEKNVRVLESLSPNNMIIYQDGMDDIELYLEIIK